MPQPVDRRHDFKPEGSEVKLPGISVLVREGFVIGHFDRMASPAWVCQRWTKVDHYRMKELPNQNRPWKVDLELPVYAQLGTSYDGNETMMDHGHMARHANNRAWGVDCSQMGCRMSNSTPQHRQVNRGDAWRQLEDMAQDIVAEEDHDIPVIWIISGTAFRDKDNPPSESPEHDFESVERVGDGFGVPYATYKIVAWFDDKGRFQARGYVFEQTDTKPDLKAYLTTLDKIEERTGLDFFPLLKNEIEDKIESAAYKDLWGAE